MVSQHAECEPLDDACAALPGYRFVNRVGSSGLGETWRAVGPDGRLRLVSILYAATQRQGTADGPIAALQALTRVRHAHLLSALHVADDGGRVVVVSEWCPTTLRDRYEACRAQGLRGVPRVELIPKLLQAAEALDFLHQDCRLRHLALSPRSVYLQADNVAVADFGLVEWLHAAGDPPMAQLSPRYAAPELFEDWPCPASDQYALALIYQEMLTGTLPHRGPTLPQLVRNRLSGHVDLEPLSGLEREVMRRALATDPHQRYETCTEFVLSLRACLDDRRVGLEAAARIRAEQCQAAAVPAWYVDVPANVLELDAGQIGPAIRELMPQALDVSAAIASGLRCRFAPDGTLVHRCPAWMPDAVAARKLDGILHHWNAERVQRDELSVSFEISLPVAGWRRMLGRVPTRFAVAISRTKSRNAMGEVEVRISRADRATPHDPSAVRQFALVFLEDLHRHLLAGAERRVEDRSAFDQPLRVEAYRPDAPAAALWLGRGKDISATGVGLYLPEKPTSEQIFLYQESAAAGGILRIPAAVARVLPCADGWYETGARFLLEDFDRLATPADRPGS